MSDPYEEIVAGETVLRRPPGLRHEVVCERLHQVVAQIVGPQSTSRLLPARTVVQLAPGTLVRPDLTLVTTATGKPWLIAEVVDNVDHSADTVMKKSLYEDLRMPRLWMVDPRYGNVEVYHGSQYGLSLREILASRDFLTEKLLPELRIPMVELFAFEQ
jgi:hypothetical protein